MLVSFSVVLRITSILLFFPSHHHHHASSILLSSYMSSLLASCMRLRSCSSIGTVFWSYVPLCPQTAMSVAFRSLKRKRRLIEAIVLLKDWPLVLVMCLPTF